MLVTAAHACQRGATSPKYAESAIVADYGMNMKVGYVLELADDGEMSIGEIGEDGVRSEEEIDQDDYFISRPME
jgi:hypothetical protein